MVADAAGESAYAPAPAAAAPAGRANPYVGPRAIESGEALFGRDNETVELLNQVIAHRVVLMYAVSGAGKTSLLKAGLIPALEARGFLPLPPVQVRCAAPPSVRANRYTLSVLMELEAARGKAGGDVLPPERLAALSLKDYLRDRAPAGDGRVLVFDQFEDVLRIDPTDTDVKEEFFAGVGAVLRDAGVWAIFAMREEYVAGLDPYLRHLPTRLTSRYRLPLLSEAAATEAVCGPAEAASVPFRPEVAQQLVDQLRRTRVQQLDGTVEEKLGSTVEPVQLQVVCQLVWERLPPGATEVGPAALTGFSVDRALEEYYGKKVHAAAQSARVREWRVRKWVERHLITEQGLRGQILKSHPTTGGLSTEAVEALVGAYIVRAEQRLNATWYELTHDRLVEPIRRSNRAWWRRQMRRLLWYALLVGVALGFLFARSVSAYVSAYTSSRVAEEVKSKEEKIETLSEEKKELEQTKRELEGAKKELETKNRQLDAAYKATVDPALTTVQPGAPGISTRKVLWPVGSTLRVHFMNGTPKQREDIERYAHEWTKYANLTFDFGAPQDKSDVRVSVTPPGGAYSYLGTDARQHPGQATVVLGPLSLSGTGEAEARRVTQHEFGHVLGLLHEYQNPNGKIVWDQAATIAYFRPIASPGLSDAQILDQVRAFTPEQFGDKPFDPDSIMMYSFPSKLVKPGSAWTDPSKVNNVLSRGDKLYASTLYPFREPRIPVAVAGREPGERPHTQQIQRLKLDRFQFEAKRPGRYMIETKYADPGLEVYLMGPGDEITQIAENDSKRPPESRVEADLKPGTYVIIIRHLKPTKVDSYTIRVSYVGRT